MGLYWNNTISYVLQMKNKKQLCKMKTLSSLSQQQKQWRILTQEQKQNAAGITFTIC